VLAVDAGSVTFGRGELPGVFAVLHAQDGARYFYGHLLAVEGDPRPVKAGDVIGYVGDSGNAQGKPSHVHFEISPTGKDADTVNPFPLLLAVPNSPAHLQTTPFSKAKRDSSGFFLLLCFAGMAFLEKSRGPW